MPATAPGARAPSIPASTSRSKRRPAPARRACSSIATSTCCAPASIRRTSWRSRSRARPPPRCASASSRRCARQRRAARSRSARWRELRDRTGDIAISTIDAFCLSLLREFPLEADLDPGFSMADDTEVPRLIDESLDRALRICRSLAREDEHVAPGVRAARRPPGARRAGGAAQPAHRRAGGAGPVSGDRARAI